MGTLERTRKEIREIDAQMAALFQKRMEVVREVADHKKERGLPVLDEEQEKRVMERNTELVTDPEIREYYPMFMQEVMALSRKYQERLIGGTRVAFSGTPGAFAHIAARKIFPEGNCISFPSFDEAYLSVVEGECDYAVLPIENSYAGEVGQTVDLMFHGILYVNGVYSLPVIHNLLGVQGARPEDIRMVISHPQALSQCETYIRRHGYQEQTEVNTAVAAERVAKAADLSVAAIASIETAAIYGLQVLDHDINESKDNTTRFAVFARTQNELSTERDGNRFILLFRVNNVSGALADALQVISRYGFNMNVLRSRPIRTTPWKYYFYAEVEGSPASQDGKKMIRELRDHCDMLRVVGQFIKGGEL
ncbi:MAG: bifunctional chorismate mutase/prephenate dehydratase [Sarcina sp.]|nr:bifunctional chorismate mutase/prephenate dehydratase [Sarcina sp.]